MMIPDVWMPHGQCVNWAPALLTIQILSNLLIGICYMLIPTIIMSGIKPVNDRWSRLFAAFILLCGMTHFMQILTVWQAWYWLEAGVLASTAIVSVMTVVNLYLYGAELISKAARSGERNHGGP